MQSFGSGDWSPADQSPGFFGKVVPYAIPALATAGLGYGAYKAYKHFYPKEDPAFNAVPEIYRMGQVAPQIKSRVPYYQMMYQKLSQRASNPKGAMHKIVPPIYLAGKINNKFKDPYDDEGYLAPGIGSWLGYSFRTYWCFEYNRWWISYVKENMGSKSVGGSEQS